MDLRTMHLIREKRLRDSSMGRTSSPRWLPKQQKDEALEQLQKKPAELLTLDDRLSLRDLHRKQREGWFSCFQRCFAAPPKAADAFQEELIAEPYPISESSSPRRQGSRRADLM